MSALCWHGSPFLLYRGSVHPLGMVTARAGWNSDLEFLITLRITL